MVVVPEIVTKETSEEILIYIYTVLHLPCLCFKCTRVELCANQTINTGKAVCTCTAIVIYVKRAKIIYCKADA